MPQQIVDPIRFEPALLTTATRPLRELRVRKFQVMG